MEFEQKELPNIIKVIGIGGGGGNAVNYMFKQGIKGVDFVVCNTDAQALHNSPIPIKVKLGNRKLGAGSKPDVGRQAAIDSVEEIKEALTGETEMLFITAGMGGGTGTGAAPIIAQVAKEMGVLVVGIVTLPFEWEGQKRLNLAQKGIEELKSHVDTLIVISNNKLREVYGNLSLTQAFGKADDILKTAAKGIAELITVPGYVNVDFEDVKTVMTENESGKAIMSSAQAEGEDRSTRAVQEALNSPLLDDNDIAGASDILLHIITGEKELMMDEVEEITTFVQSQAGNGANLIWGNGTDASLGDALSVTIIATGFNKKKRNTEENPNKVVIDLESAPEPVFSPREEVIDETPATPSVEESTLISKEKPKEEAAFTAPAKEATKPPIHKKVHDLFETTPVKENEIPVKESVSEKKIESEPVTDEIEFEVKNTLAPVEQKDEKEVKHAEERRKKLKGLSSLSSSNLAEMEKVPAYQRRKVEIDNRTLSSEENISRYTLGSDENNNPVINKGNSFLHDNVD
ncbi:MAG: cell division protein FtsZ [Bacteroidetes bacterium]|nr:MAG: cell division protein FtsZ [Bacteroidota bacterium]